MARAPHRQLDSPHPTWRLGRSALAWLLRVPIVGIVVFVALYLYSATLYPGGEQFFPNTVGYDHLDNYWCDLLRVTTYSGAPNPARSPGALGTILLPLSLIPLWLSVPRSFGRPSLRAGVRVAGTVSMLACTLVTTPLHDVAISISAPLGLLAFGLTVLGQRHDRNAALTASAVLAAVLGVANYFMWAFDLYLVAMPAVQKAALVSFLCWVVLCTRAARREADL